jgi:hypothetical protein
MSQRSNFLSKHGRMDRAGSIYLKAGKAPSIEKIKKSTDEMAVVDEKGHTSGVPYSLAKEDESSITIEHEVKNLRQKKALEEAQSVLKQSNA